MADYFDEMGWEEHERDNIEEHQLLLFARMLIEAGFIEPDGESPPASQKAVSNLDKRIVQSDCDDEQCVICLATLKKNDIMVKMPCKHEFHDKCILPWLKQRNTCPQCRFEMETDDPLYERGREYRARESDRKHDIESLHNSMFS